MLGRLAPALSRASPTLVASAPRPGPAGGRLDDLARRTSRPSSRPRAWPTPSTLIVGKEDVDAVKPDPEGYRLALARLKVTANAAVALEDSPTGLAAARGAGLRAVAVGHRRAAGEWTGTAAFVPDLTRTRELLNMLGLES